MRIWKQIISCVLIYDIDPEKNVTTLKILSSTCNATLHESSGDESNIGIAWQSKEDAWTSHLAIAAAQLGTVKPVYNDHLMGYFSAFWSSRWPRAT